MGRRPQEAGRVGQGCLDPGLTALGTWGTFISCRCKPPPHLPYLLKAGETLVP